MRLDKLTIKAQEALQSAQSLAGKRSHQALMPEHLLAALVRQKVRKLILLGEDAETIAQELGSLALHEHAGDMRDAVKRAFASAAPGDTVLLAPACASFDMFDSFEQRGEVFKEEVTSLESRV